MYSARRQWKLLKEEYHEKEINFIIEESRQLNESWSWFSSPDPEESLSGKASKVFGKVSDWVDNAIDNLDNMSQDTKKVTNWDDFKTLVEIMINQRNLEKFAEKGGGLAAKTAKITMTLAGASVVPAALEAVGQAKDMLDFVQMAADMPDEEAEKAPLADTMNIDDGYSEMVDDRLENKFLKWLSGTYLFNRSGNIDASEDNINAIFEKYLEERGSGAETVAAAETSGKITDLTFPKALKTAYNLMKKGVTGLAELV
tara:strand:- start:1604 stop:2374 length:771 start_codon:yes stop_codon:yes gene_type:complete